MDWQRLMNWVDVRIEERLRRAGITTTGVGGGNIIGPIPSNTLPSHNHTSADGDGGQLSGAQVDTFQEFLEQGSDPSAPAANRGRFFGKDSGGQTMPYWRRENGDVLALLGSAGGGAATIYTSAYASPPASPASGDLWLPSDSYLLLRYTGAAWVPWGPLFPCTAPISGDFSWENQGGSSIDTSKGGVYLLAPAVAAYNLRIRHKAAPSTPYTIEVAFLPHLYAANFGGAGVLFRQSSDGKVHGFILVHDSVAGGMALVSGKATNATTFSANYVAQTVAMPQVMFMRIQDNGTNRICSWSADGQHWHVFHTVGRTDFLTADQVGFYVQSQNATYPAGMTLLSWKEG